MALLLGVLRQPYFRSCWKMAGDTKTDHTGNGIARTLDGERVAQGGANALHVCVCACVKCGCVCGGEGGTCACMWRLDQPQRLDSFLQENASKYDGISVQRQQLTEQHRAPLAVVRSTALFKFIQGRCPVPACSRHAMPKPVPRSRWLHVPPGLFTT